MPSTITKVKTIRIKNETAEYFNKKPLNRYVENLAEMVQAGKIKLDGEKLVVKGGRNIDFEDIEEMAALMSVTTDKLLKDIRELLEEGELYYSEGRLVNPRYEEFEKACRGKDIDQILESVIRSL